MAQPGVVDATNGGVTLVLRDCRRGDTRAVASGRMHRKAAPARTNLEHVVLRAQLELSTQPVELLDLRVVQRRRLVLEDGARVRHGLVEHDREEVIRQVVVCVNVLAVPRLRGFLVRHQRPGETSALREPVEPRARRLGGPEQVAHERGHVRGVPQPVHVAATHAPGATEDERRVGASVAHRQIRHQLPATNRPLGVMIAPAFHHAQRPDTSQRLLVHQPQEQPTGKRLEALALERQEVLRDNGDLSGLGHRRCLSGWKRSTRRTHPWR